MQTAPKLLTPETANPWEIIDNLRCSIDSKDHEIQLLKEQVQYLLNHRFGRKSEQSDPNQGRLFEETQKEQPEQPVSIEVPAHKRSKGGRRNPPANLERIRIEHKLPESQQTCSCCGEALQIRGEQISERYQVEPARFWIEEHVRYTYGGCRCRAPLVTAPYSSPPPLPRTQASAGMLAWIGSGKFVDNLPANRIAAILQKRFGLPFSATTLADWMIKAAQRLITPLLAAFEQALNETDYLHIDETTLQVLEEPGRSAKQKSYLWARVSGTGTPVVLVHYSPSRRAEVATQLLQAHQGYLHTDGYGGYDPIARSEAIIQLGCWAVVDGVNSGLFAAVGQ
jgi:transposase